MSSTAPTGRAAHRIGEIAGLFLRLGALGFGGPAAHVAMMRDEVVRRKGWVDDEEFLELVGATQMVPGPNSTELAIHLGHHRGGWRGLLVAGVCFIGPAVAIVSLLAWLYATYGTSPAVIDVRYGVMPVIIAVIANALWGLGRKAYKGWLTGVIAVGAMAAFLLDVNELIMLVIGGVATAIAAAVEQQLASKARNLSVAFAAVAANPDTSLGRLFAVFLEVGAVMFGSGYVLLAYLQRHLVEDLGWLSSQQLLDAIAVGQVTPGPVFTTATFVGWQVEGPLGAVVATVGIFAPSFVFVALLSRIVPWMRARPIAKAVLTGLTAVSLGLMAGVLVQLTQAGIVDPVTAVIAAVSLAILTRTKLNAAWLIAAGALIGAIRNGLL